MYVDRLRDGRFGVYLDNGRRVAIRASRSDADKHLKRLRSRMGDK